MEIHEVWEPMSWTLMQSYIKECISYEWRDSKVGSMSEGDVMSGVAQSTVLAAVLFVIMTSAIDKGIKKCILCFANYTRVRKKIICNKDNKWCKNT